MILRLIVYLLASIAGIWTAWHLARRRRPQWKLLSMLGILIALVMFGDLLMPGPWSLRYEDFFHGSMVPVAFLAFAVPVEGILAADLLSSRLLRLLVMGLMCLAFFKVVWLEPLDALSAVRELSRIHAHVEKNGVCAQSTGYTCGPAAGVTALRRLGITADEGGLALRAETGRYFGTDEFRLARAMNRAFSGQGLHCEVVDFHDVEEMAGLSPVIVVRRLDGNICHYIVVLEATRESVEYADPLSGMTGRMPVQLFKRDWLMRGIKMIRTPETSAGSPK